MTTTQLSQWFDRGVAEGATHMAVICDTETGETHNLEDGEWVAIGQIGARR